MISGYRLMWLLVMFDLPVLTREDRKHYRDFHDFLEEDGYTRMQFSVYARPCATEENTEVHVNRVIAKLPPDGEVRLLKFTDKQWMRMMVFRQMVGVGSERAPEQLLFFDDDLEPLFDEAGNRDVEHRIWTGLAEGAAERLAKKAGRRKRKPKGRAGPDDGSPTFEFFD